MAKPRRKQGRAGWVAEVFLGRDEHGKQVKRSVSARTYKECLALAKAVEREAEVREVVTGKKIEPKRTVEDLLTAWVAAGTWSPTTRYGYERVIARHLLPTFGHLPVSKLRADHLDKLYKEMRDQGLSGRSIRNVHATLRAALGRAVKWGWVPFNVADRATPGPVHGNLGREATQAEVDALLAAADSDLGFAIRLAVFTGARRSELCGLLWSDVDFERGEITIRRATIDAGGRTYQDRPTKTRQTRSVPLRAPLLPFLRERRGFGSILNASPITLSRRLAALCDEVGIQDKGFGWHAFRHFFLTELAGVADLRTVSDIAGHSTVRTTERYVHTREDRKRAAIEALDALDGLG